MKLEEIALKYGLCNCNEAYTSRNLTAPDCPFHAFAIQEAMEEYAKECIESSLKKASENLSIYYFKDLNEKRNPDDPYLPSDPGSYFSVDIKSITDENNIILK